MVKKVAPHTNPALGFDMAHEFEQACRSIPFLTRFSVERIGPRVRESSFHPSYQGAVVPNVRVKMWVRHASGQELLCTVSYRDAFAYRGRWEGLVPWLRHRAALVRDGGHYYGNN